MSKKILIQALNLKNEPIAGFIDDIKLFLENDDKITIPCSEERECGIYVFDITSDKDLCSLVFVALKNDKQIGNITYHKEPYFLHPTCMQINILECMINTDKAIPFHFSTYDDTNTPAIGIIKAYKFQLLNNRCGNVNEAALGNTELDYKLDWQNEVYTIDMEQTVRLQAFISKSSANRDLIDDISRIDLNQIRWGYKIKNTKPEKNILAYPKINKKNITTLENKFGTNILLNLKKDIINHNIDIIPNKDDFDTGNNIIIFAYIEDKQGKIENLGYRKPPHTEKEKPRIKTIQCIELKILQTRFYLHYDGGVLELLENERVIDSIVDENNQIESFIAQYITQTITTNKQNNISQNTILENGKYTLRAKDNKSVITIFEQARYYNLSNTIKECFKRWASIYKDIFSASKDSSCSCRDDNAYSSLALVVERNKDIVIEVERFYEDIKCTLSRFRITLNNIEHKCNNHTQETNPQILDSCKDCQKMKELVNEFSAFEGHYFLERSGPDCITPDLELRIPEGRYYVEWKYSGVSLIPSGTFYDILQQNEVGAKRHSSKPLLNLSNKYVSIDRGIMLHIGYDITWTEGCLLFGSKIKADDNKSQTIVGSKEDLKKNKEEYSNSLANKVLNFLIQNQKIKNALKGAIANKQRQKIPNITFIIKNKFEIKS